MLPACLLAAALLATSGPTPAWAQHEGPGSDSVVDCDIVVAGGSTASLAAAITAAEAAKELTVCFTEITDWPGGQMTAGGVPAIDFGGANNNPANQPASFLSAMESIPGSGAAHTATEGSGSPGACSVSTKCYLPNVLVSEWINPRLAASPNLKVFLSTAVTGTSRDPGTGAITSLTAVMRAPKPGTVEWSQRLSEELPDWYTPTNSAAFSKTTLTLKGKVFIEATELGDVLATSGEPFAQGIEYPLENSTSYENCGQAQTLTFYMELLPEGSSYKPGPVPPGADGGIPFGASYPQAEWEHAWTWRRAFCAGNRSLGAVNPGDVSQQNLGNDLDTAYLFPPLDDVKAEARSGWRGGVNLTAMRMLEDRAFGWFHFLVNTSSAVHPGIADRLVLNKTTSGTAHGLSKMVYWRDTRRAFRGVGGFQLTHPPLRDNVGETGVHFNDSVAMGDYNDDTHHLRIPTCVYPPYIGNGRGEGAKPYYVPFRALTVENVSNLLVAGKSMSQSFHANSNTRLHPSEWTTGVAAGGAAVLMVRRQWSTSDALREVAQVQQFLNSSAVGAPLVWSGITYDGANGTVCELGRCFGVDAAAAAKSTHHHGDDTCGGSEGAAGCTALGKYEWLANAEFWTSNATVGSCIYATSNTVLKKSTVTSGSLPPDELWPVSAGEPCRLVNASQFAGYWLCSHRIPNRTVAV